VPTWAVLAAAAGLIAMVTFASRSTAVPLAGAFDMRLLFRTVEVAGYVALFFGLVAIPWVVLLRASRRAQNRGRSAARQRTIPPAPAWAQVIGVLLIGAFAVAQIALMVSIINDLLRAAGTALDDAVFDTDGDGEIGPFSFADGDGTALTMALLITALISTVAIVFWFRWRRADDAIRDGDVGLEPMRHAAEVSLEALAREPDPRRAIIAAYAAMERSLARAGLGRFDSEAPIEYLLRVLSGPTRAAEEIRTVSGLFQVAKFSDHAVDEAMRSQAIDALERIRTSSVAAT
jgi:hypothetical protein